MKKLLLSFAIIALILSGCSKDDCNCPEVEADSELAGDISSNVTLDASIEYTLIGTLRVKDGGVLTIPAGTVIKSEKGFSKFIIVEQGGKINVNGTADAPVTMTSAAASPDAGDWGGLIINGKATISGTDLLQSATTEVDPTTTYGAYNGATNDADNSGSITYLILAYTGAKSSSSVEHNGLTLNAVGSGTKIENVYVPFTADDGVEFFGGSVNVTNLLVVNSDDDMFDLTQGWKGELKNAYGIWETGFTSGESDPRGIESDGNWDGLTPDDLGQSNFKMTNITIENNSSYVMEDGIKVRRGATGTITNVLLKGGSAKNIVDMTDGKGDANSASVVDYKVDGMTATSDVVNQSDPASTVTENAANTGADASVFGWTDYAF